jgi:predicted nucleic acid-binding Zn ribbon protein
MNRKENEEPLGGVINRLLKAYGLEEGYYTAALITHWEKMMGPAIAKRTKKLTIKNGVLRVEVESAVIREEMMYSKTSMIRNINKEIGHPLVKDIVIV